MAIKIGRAELRTPRVVPAEAQDVAVPSVSGPFVEDAYRVQGVELGSDAETRVVALEKEWSRPGHVHVEADAANVIETGHYAVMPTGETDRPRGSPSRRPWEVLLVKKARPYVRFEAEDGDVRHLGATADPDASEEKRIRYTPDATERVVGRFGSSLVLALRLDETGGTDGSNLVTNPGFETYTTTPGVPDSWSLGSGTAGDWSKETTIKRSGNNAVKFLQTDAVTAPRIIQAISVTAGKSYYVEVYARTGGSASDKASLRIRNTTDGANVVNVEGTAGATTFEKLSGTFLAVAGKSYEIWLGEQTGAADTTLYFDDALVQEVQAKDSSGLGNHGTLKGGTNTAGPTINATGKIGTGYTFDGTDDYVTVADHATLKPAAAVTVEAWFKVSSFGGNVDCLLEKGGTTAGNHGYAVVFRSAGRMAFGLADGSTNYVLEGVKAGLGDGAWHHVAAVWDGSTMYLYVDGVLDASRAAAPTTITGTRALTIGSIGGASDWTSATLDEVRVYDRALSAAEVKKRYDDTTGGTRPAADHRAPLDPALDLPEMTVRVQAKVKPLTTATRRLRARLLDGDGEQIAQGSQVTPGTADAWQVVDLGTIAVPTANASDNVLHILVDDPTNTDGLDIDHIDVTPA
jgi:hypothetical protein